MKRISLVLISALLLILSLFGCSPAVKHPSTQEYIPAQGNIKGSVSVNDFTRHGEAFEIGANEEGYAVFKDPHKAFQAMEEECPDGIQLIQDEFDLPALTASNYADYKTYGWQVTSGTKEQKSQAGFVASFLDIYENSFIDR